MPPPVRLILTVVPVGPRKKTLDQQYFALHMAMAYDCSGQAATDLPLPWSSVGNTHVALDPSRVLTVRDDAGHSFTTKLEQSSTPADKTSQLAAIQGWIDAPGAGQKGIDAYDPCHRLDFSARSNGKLVLSAQLAYLATLPGGAAQQLGLVGYFKLPMTAANITKFVVAPQIVNGLTLGSAAPVSAPSPDRGFLWGYSGAGVVAQVQFVSVTSAPTGGLRFDNELAADESLDLDTYWFKPREILPWAEDLPARLHQIADVFGRLLDFRHTLASPNRDLDTAIVASLGFDATWNLAGSTQADGTPLPDTAAVWNQVDPSGKYPAVKAAAAGLLALLDAPKVVATTWAAVLQTSLRLGSPPTVENLAAAHIAGPGGTPLAPQMLFLQWAYAVAISNDPSAQSQWKELVGTAPFSAAKRAFGADVLPIGPAGSRRIVMAKLKKDFAATIDKKAGVGPREAAVRVCSAFLTGSLKVLAQRRPKLTFDASKFSAEWSAYVASFVGALFTDLPTYAAGADAPRPTQAGQSALPDGLSVQLGEPHVLATDQVDAWHNLAGVGLIVRDHQDGGWRIVSAAMMLLDETTLAYDDPVLVPLRMPYRDGVLIPTLTYDNRSPVARSAIADALVGSATSVLAVSGSADSEPVGPISSRFTYDAVTKRTIPDPTTNLPVEKDYPDNLKLVPLRYGRTYDVAAFMMDLGHGLPAELADTSPWIAKPSQVTGTWTPPYPCPVTYKRRVGVASIRLSPMRGKSLTDWPTVPDDVYPLATEIDRELKLISPDTTSAGHPHLGPVLLWAKAYDAAHASFRVGVRPPSVGIDVLERSLVPVGSKTWPDVFDDLVDAYAWYIAQLERGQATKDPLVDQDVSFDDPTFQGYVVALETFDLVSLTWRLGATSKMIAASRLSPRPNEPHRSDWMPIDVVPGAQVAVDITPSGPAGVKATVVTPGLTRLRIYAVVDGTNFADTALNPARANLNDPTDGAVAAACVQPGSSLALLAPTTVMFEVPADNAFPTEAELALALGFSPRVERRQVTLTLSRPVPSFANVGRVEVLRQPWRWQGTPVPEFDSEHPATWEEVAFAGLDDELDARVVPVGYFPIGKCPSTDPVTVYTDRLDDPRAQYVRYAVRIRSRYEGLAKEHAIDDAVAIRTSAWQSMFVPFTGAKPSKPVIKAMVPLTIAPGDTKSNVAPLLVVLDEEAFVQCGMTETIVCRVDTVTSPEPSSSGEELLQYGHDPILTSDAYIGDSKSGITIELVKAGLPGGPFGHTFDAPGTRLPLFSSSSYMFAPRASSGPVRPWDFARIRLRRMAVGTAPVAAPVGESDPDWTDPVWVQFLPPSKFGPTAFQPLVDGQGTQVGFTGTFDDPTMGALKLSRRFLYAALVTERAYDYRGDPNHEALRGICPADLQDGSPFRIEFRIKPEWIDLRLRVRLLEVQVADGKGATDVWGSSGISEAAFWGGLIREPQDATSDVAGAGDTTHRIVRISAFVNLGDEAQSPDEQGGR